MTISPMRRDSITRSESNNLKSYIDDGFGLTNEHIDHVEIKIDNIEIKFDNLEKSMSVQFKETNKSVDDIEVKMDKQFKGVNKRIDNLEINMDKRFAEQKENIDQLTNLVTKIATKII